MTSYIDGIKQPVIREPKNTFLIEQESDFPVQDATTITLNTWIYNLNAAIVTGKRFIIPDGSVVTLSWSDPFIAGITYTWTWDMFTWADFLSLTHHLIFLSCPLWKLFNITNATPKLSQIFIDNTVYTDISDIGVTKNIDIVAWLFNAFQDIGQWFVFDSVRLINFSQVQLNWWKNEVWAVMFTFKWTIDWIALSNIDYKPKSNEFIFDIKSSLVIDWGTITSQVFNSSLWGGLFATGSKDQTDIKLNFQANLGMPKSIVFGNMTIPSTETVTITTLWVPVIINDTNTGGTDIWSELWKSSRFTFSSSNGRYTYTGLEDVNVTVTMSSSIEKVWWWSNFIATFIAKNWTVIAESKSWSKNADSTNVVSIAEIALSTWNFIEGAAQNDDWIANIIIDISNFTIKD